MTKVENDVSVSFVHKKPEIPIKYNLGTIPYLLGAEKIEKVKGGDAGSNLSSNCVVT